MEQAASQARSLVLEGRISQAEADTLRRQLAPLIKSNSLARPPPPPLRRSKPLVTRTPVVSLVAIHENVM